MHSKPQAFRETLSSSEVVSAMSEGLEGLASWVFLGDGWVMVEFFGNFSVRVETFLEHGFELWLVRLPNDNSKVSRTEVNVEEGISGVRHHQASNVWQR